MSYGQKTVLGNFSENLKMLFLKNAHKPWIFDNKIFLTVRWQYPNPKNQPCSSFGGRAMNSGVPKNDNFRLLGVGDGGPLLIPINPLGTTMVIPNKATRGTPYWSHG